MYTTTHMQNMPFQLASGSIEMLKFQWSKSFNKIFENKTLFGENNEYVHLTHVHLVSGLKILCSYVAKLYVLYLLD